MSSPATSAPPTRHPVAAALDHFRDSMTRQPELLSDDVALDVVWTRAVRASGGDTLIAQKETLRWAFANACQRDQLLAVVRSMKEEKPTLGRALSRPFPMQTNGTVHHYVYVKPLGRPDLAPSPFEIAETDGDPAGGGLPLADLPEPPYLARIAPQIQMCFGPATDVPPPPLANRILDVVAARSTSPFDGLGEVETEDGGLLHAPLTLTRNIEAKIEQGEDIRVRSEDGVATAIYQAKDKAYEDWLQFPSLEGPSLHEMVWPKRLRDEWDRDVRNLVKGRPVRVCCVGPTGVGKSDGALRAGRDAAKQAAKQRGGKGLAIIRLGPSYAGSPYVNQYALNIGRACRRARDLVRRGYVVLIIFDEADSVLGEMDGYEGAHDRKTRLAAQAQLSQGIPGVGIYLTMNPRRNSWLPAAIRRRFAIRKYPPPSRRQIAGVAALYASDAALKALGIGRAEFGGIFADNLYSDDRIVARGHFHSGATVEVRARDLHSASPGKVRDLVLTFCRDVEDGEADSLDALWQRLDREFVVPDLNRRNLFDLTFLAEPAHDSVRTVEILR